MDWIATKMVFPSMYIYFKTIQERISFLIFFNHYLWGNKLSFGVHARQVFKHRRTKFYEVHEDDKGQTYFIGI